MTAGYNSLCVWRQKSQEIARYLEAAKVSV
jgi:hypothetical protein